MRSPFFLLAIFLFSQPAWAAYELWVCQPSSAPKTDPRLLILNDTKGGLVLFTEKDFEIDGQVLPRGQYPGSKKLSSSGKSLIADFSVQKHIHNKWGMDGSFLSVMLAVAPGYFATELYAMYPAESDPNASLLNYYFCRHRIKK